EKPVFFVNFIYQGNITYAEGYIILFHKITNFMRICNLYYSLCGEVRLITTSTSRAAAGRAMREGFIKAKFLKNSLRRYFEIF
ncbi:MAG: hypothetical protein Q8O89_03770, partial [Nanoarchaeota archaeon]|nr:hypothetical protein [Nanoarchaeota archaeon]